MITILPLVSAFYVETAKPVPRIEDDIYKLALASSTTASVSVPSNTSAAFSSEHVSQEPVKWVCSACTFYNWPRSRRCVQCLTVRPRRSQPAVNIVSSVSAPTTTTLPLIVNVNVTAHNTTATTDSGATAVGGSGNAARRSLCRWLWW